MYSLATIKQVAKEADVSIATVSHVINKTRYVSPDLVERVEQAIHQLGYNKKAKELEGKFKLGKKSEVAIILPTVEGTLYSKLTSQISLLLTEQGYTLTVYFHNDDAMQEKNIITNILNNSRIVGCIIVPVSNEEKQFSKLIAQKIPFIFLDRTVKIKNIAAVLSDSKGGIYRGCNHLLKSGHEEIVLLVEPGKYSTSEQRITGYKEALEDYKIPFNEQLVIEVDHNHLEEVIKKIKILWQSYEKPAFIATGNRITLSIVKIINKLGLECPTDVSVIGFGDEEWSEIINPPLTILKQDTMEMARQSVNILLEKIVNEDKEGTNVIIPMELLLQKSTQVIGKGPFGEKPVSPEELTLTKDEEDRLQKGNFKVGISFHYGGNAWTRLYENGIRNILDKYGVSIVSITNAHFDPNLQVTQLEGLRMQNPDAIIAIPVDDELTSKKFQSLSQDTKLIFMSSVPEGMTRDQYSTCVSVNERENGQNVASLMGNYFKGMKNVKVGFIGHGAPFYGTHLRDAVAIDILRSNYANIQIVDDQYFYEIEKTYEVCKKMVMNDPNIQGLYISWDRPALEAIKALKELKREDIAIFTYDLDQEIATYLAKEEMVKGLSSQKPYQQGIAVGLATAKALLGHDVHKYIGVPPEVVESKNLLKSWRNIIMEPAPSEIEKLFMRKFT